MSTKKHQRPRQMPRPGAKNDQPKPINPFEKKENNPNRKEQKEEEVESEQQRKETLTERD